jgi:putative ATP-binding cassette transporter
VTIAAKIDEEIDQCGGFRLREGSVTIKAGEKVMINGDHNVNRKLLFLALSELWPCGGGKIGLPPADDMLFVPQSAYIPGGTLREALAFPEPADTYKNDDVEAALEKAGLHNLVARLDTRARWDKLLDSDEQRAIGFARLLLVRPQWMVFDEVLEGMEPEWQATMMKVLEAMPEATMIYIGRSEAYVEALSSARAASGSAGRQAGRNKVRCQRRRTQPAPRSDAIDQQGYIGGTMPLVPTVT